MLQNIGINNLSLEEFRILAPIVAAENDNDKRKTLKEIRLIDDLLEMQSMAFMLNTAFTKTEKGFRRKNVKRFRDLIDARIDEFIKKRG